MHKVWWNNIYKQYSTKESILYEAKKIGFALFLAHIFYNTPSFWHTLEERLAPNKIKSLSLIQQQNTEKIFWLLHYDIKANTVLWTSSREFDNDHYIGSYENIQKMIENIAYYKSYNTHNISIQSWMMKWTTYTKEWKLEKSIKVLIPKISDWQINYIATTCHTSNEKIRSFLCLMIQAYALETTEDMQAQDQIIMLLTKSWHSRIDINGNILWMIQWLQEYKDAKYQISTVEIEKIILTLQQHYWEWNAWFLLHNLAAEFGLEVILQKE